MLPCLPQFLSIAALTPAHGLVSPRSLIDTFPSPPVHLSEALLHPAHWSRSPHLLCTCQRPCCTPHTGPVPLASCAHVDFPLASDLPPVPNAAPVKLFRRHITLIDFTDPSEQCYTISTSLIVRHPPLSYPHLPVQTASLIVRHSCHSLHTTPRGPTATSRRLHQTRTTPHLRVLV